MTVSKLRALQNCALKIAGAGFRESAAKDAHEILPAKRLRHEFPSLSGAGVAGERGGEQRRRIEFGCHDFGQEFDGLLDATLASFFFFDCANEVVELFAGGVGEGVEEFLEAVTTQGAGEEKVDGHGNGKTFLIEISLTKPIFLEFYLL